MAAISLWHDGQHEPLMNEAFEKLAARLDGSQLRRNELLAPYTTFRIGGPADLFYTTGTADDLASAVLAARELAVPWFVLGLGANILVGDKGFRGIVIRNCASHFTFSDDGLLWVRSGERRVGKECRSRWARPVQQAARAGPAGTSS